MMSFEEVIDKSPWCTFRFLIVVHFSVPVDTSGSRQA
jgi:hypothetical protein